MRRYAAFVLFGFILLPFTACSQGSGQNGFDLSDSLIPTDEIHAGGPGRDGIPTIDHPRFVAPDQAVFLQPNDEVLGLALDGERRAYPVSINLESSVSCRVKPRALESERIP